jgi:hypothetical protein
MGNIPSLARRKTPQPFRLPSESGIRKSLADPFFLASEKHVSFVPDLEDVERKDTICRPTALARLLGRSKKARRSERNARYPSGLNIPKENEVVVTAKPQRVEAFEWEDGPRRFGLFSLFDDVTGLETNMDPRLHGGEGSTRFMRDWTRSPSVNSAWSSYDSWESESTYTYHRRRSSPVHVWRRSDFAPPRPNYTYIEYMKEEGYEYIDGRFVLHSEVETTEGDRAVKNEEK